MSSRFTMNLIKLAAVCAIIETALIFYVSHIPRQRFHDEYLSLIFENKDEDAGNPSNKVANK